VEKETIYTKEFKIYCVKQTIHTSREVKEIAKNLGVSYSLLVKWCHQYIEELNNLSLINNNINNISPNREKTINFQNKKEIQFNTIRKEHAEINRENNEIEKRITETEVKEQKQKHSKKTRKRKKVLVLLVLAITFVMLFITSCAKTPEEKQIAKTGKEQLKIKLEGVVKPFRAAKIIAPSTGKIVKIYFHNGDWINKGDIIYEISFPEIKAQIINIENQIKNTDEAIARKRRLYNSELNRKGELIRIAKAQLERIAGLYAQGYSTKREVELAEEKYFRLLDERQSTKTQYKSELINLENNKENLVAQLKALKINANKTSVKSPISGYLTSMNLIVGIEVTKGTKVGEVLNLNKVKIKAGIAAGLFKYVHKGDIVHIDFITTPPYNTKAKITRIIPIVDPKIGRMIAEIDLDNHNFLLQDGTKALITIYPSKEAQVELNKYFYKRQGASVVEIKTNIK